MHRCIPSFHQRHPPFSSLPKRNVQEEARSRVVGFVLRDVLLVFFLPRIVSCISSKRMLPSSTSTGHRFVPVPRTYVCVPTEWNHVERWKCCVGHELCVATSSMRWLPNLVPKNVVWWLVSMRYHPRGREEGVQKHVTWNIGWKHRTIP